MQYLRYFIYLAWNWDLKLAFFVLRHEIRGEKKYGQHTIGIDFLKNLNKAETLHASVSQPINYYTAELLFAQTYLEDVAGTILDMGCGKGRVFGIAAHYGFKHIIGIDFSQTLCATAAKNAANLMEKFNDVNIEVVCADAALYEIPPAVTTIFLFNPFDDFIMRKMLNRLQESIRRYPRNIKILYANPVCKKLFTDAGFTETYYFKKMNYLEGSVLETV